MATPSLLVPIFQLTFDIQAGTLTFTDKSTNRDATTYGTPRITHVGSDTILYTGSGWDPTTPTWSTPPIDGSTSTWIIADKDIQTSYNGQYKVEYWTKKGDATAVLTTRYFTLAYTAPVVDIDMTLYCSTSELNLTDSTDYDIEISGVAYVPTMSRVKTLTKPAGSGCEITPLTWTDSGTAPSVTIGGGETDATRIWTRIWQANVVTTLTYSLSSWSTSAMDIILIDTVYGDDYLDAQCDATICALAQCFRNMLDRWILSLTQNFNYREDNRDKIIQGNALWAMLQWYERCGTDTQAIIEALQTLLAGENCDCTTEDDAASVAIVPWADTTGTGGGTISTFKFWIETTDPATEQGTNGDVWLNKTSYDLFKKEAGAWVLKGNIKGAQGDPGPTDNTLLVLLHDTTEYSTPAGIADTGLSYDFQIANSQFDYANDYMMFVWDVKLAHNDHGKTIRIRFAGTEVVEYFTDELITDDNDRVLFYLKVTPISDVRQHLLGHVMHKGYPGRTFGPVIIRNHAKDLTEAQSVRLWGQNSVATASDIMCDCMLVKLYHRETELIPSGTPLYTGRGLVSQLFTATEGQTEFTVTDFDPNDYYIPIIDDAVVSQLVVTRSGYVFTYSPGLSAGQRLLIID